MIKYAIRLSGDPIWFSDGAEELFNTEAEAIQAIADEIEACEDAVRLGYMDDAGGFEDFRIVEVLC